MLQPLAPHEHAVFAYRAPGELCHALGTFVTSAHARGELSVFVHAFPTEEEAFTFLRGGDVDFDAMAEDDFFLVSFYREAFEGAGSRIDFEHVVRVVDGILDRARRMGRRGVGIFVDASRAYFDAGREDEWFAFEQRLGRRLHHAMSLVCAYPAESVRDPARRARVLDTHLYRFGV